MKKVDSNHAKIPAEQMPVMMLINEVSRLFHNHMRSEGEKIGMQEGFRQLIMHLSHEDDLTQLDLVKRTHLKAPTVSVTLRKMEAAGLVTRETDQIDQRQTRVKITESGKRMDKLIKQNIKKTEDIFVRGISEADCQTLKRILLRMRENILSYDEWE